MKKFPRRKQLGNALSGGLEVPREKVRAALRRAEIDDRRRAETLTLEEWRRLAGIIRRSGEQ